MKISAGGEATDRAIVFVHGFTANLESFLPWACLIHREQASAATRYDLLLFQYPTALLGCPETLDSAANALEHFLGQPELSRYREVLFVAHSFGGLVTLRYAMNIWSSHHRLRLQGEKVFLLGVPLDGAALAKWGRTLSCQAEAAHIGSQELTRLRHDLMAAYTRPGPEAPPAATPIEIHSLVAADDEIVAPSESLLAGLPIATEKVVSVRDEGGVVPATHHNLIRVVSTDHPAHLVLRKMMVTPWAPPTPKEKIGIWIARISPEHEGQHQRTLKRLLEKLLDDVPTLKGRVEVRLVDEDLGTCDQPGTEGQKIVRLAQLVNARVMLWGKALSYGPSLEICMLSRPYGVVEVRRLDWLPLAMPIPDPVRAAPTLGAPLTIAKLAVARILAEEGQYTEAETLLAPFVTSSASGYEPYALYTAAAIQGIKAEKSNDRNALALAKEYLHKAREAAIASGDESAASALTLVEAVWTGILDVGSGTSPESLETALRSIEDVIVDARKRGEKMLLARGLLYAGLFYYLDFGNSFSLEGVDLRADGVGRWMEAIEEIDRRLDRSAGDVERGIRALEEAVQLIPMSSFSLEEVVAIRMLLGAHLYARGFIRVDKVSFERALEEFEQVSVVSTATIRPQRTQAILSAIMCMLKLNRVERVMTFAPPLLTDLADKEAEAVVRYLLSEAMRRAALQGGERQIERFREAFYELDRARRAAEGVAPLAAIIENTRGKWYSQIRSQRQFRDTAAAAYESAIDLATRQAAAEGQGWWTILYGRRPKVMDIIRDQAWFGLGRVREEMAKLAEGDARKLELFEAARTAYIHAGQTELLENQRVAAEAGSKRVEREIEMLKWK